MKNIISFLMRPPRLVGEGMLESGYWTFTDASGTVFCNFKTYGGTERQVNGIIEVEETAQITCWFRPDIASGCRLKRLADGAVYEIIGDPEDIELRHQFLKFKIRRIKGGA